MNVPAVTPDPRRRGFVNPTRIVWTGPTTTLDREQALLHDGADECILIAGEQGGSVVLDFGREWHGGVQVLAGAIRNPENKLRPGKVRLRFGESVSEVLSEPNNDHAVHDMTVSLPFHTVSEFGQTGFRFVRLDLIEPGWRVALRQVRAVALEQPWRREGAFRCDDETLNAVWDTAVRTVHLCCQEFIWDGIKRDRMAWAGDVHPQVGVLAGAFGLQAGEIVEATLDRLVDTTDSNGWINGASTYSLWWILSLRSWFDFTGEVELLGQHVGQLQAVVRQVRKHVEPDGTERLTGWRFLDWPTARAGEALNPGISALTAWALEGAAGMFGRLGEARDRDASRAVSSAIRSRPFQPGPLKQSAALGVLAGLLPDARGAGLLAETTREMSPWFGGYALEALARGGEVRAGLEMLREYWGGMLDLGATTFWEHFDPGWVEGGGRIDESPRPGLRDVHAEVGDHCFSGTRHSLCHGWAGGPASWLARWVLGVQPTCPGMREVCIRPHLGDLEQASGIVPTPRGGIAVRHCRLADGTVETEVDAPADIEIRQPSDRQPTVPSP